MSPTLPPRAARRFYLALALFIAIPAPALCESANGVDPGPIEILAIQGTGLHGSQLVLVDGEVASDGGAWDAPLAVVFDPVQGAVRFELEAASELRAALLQADADDVYRLESSLDGLSFQPLAEAPALAGLAGLRTRAVEFPPTRARYVRLVPGPGDGRASVSELQLFAVPPAEWRPRLEVRKSVPLDEPAERRAWDDVTSRWWQLALALGALAFLGLERLRERRAGIAEASRRRRPLAFAVLALAVATYFNFGAFHFGNFLHNWDLFHYYVGAKYFPELRYDGLYDCVAVADAADPAAAPRVAARRIRDLRRNQLVPAADIVAHPERCTERFSPARWDEFQRDVAWFRGRETPARWDQISADHGFNATPVWMIAGSTLANLAPASSTSVTALALVDPLLFLVAVALLVWGFGLRTATIALLVLATSFPSRFFWTGGAYLRWDWLLFLVAALALARRGRPLAAGAALGAAALLRLFPAVLAAGPGLLLLLVVLAAAARALQSRGESRRWLATIRGALVEPHALAALRFCGGFALAAAILVPASFVVAGGPDAWAEFAANTAKHKQTPLTNNMGLAMVLTYHPAESGRYLKSGEAVEPWAAWKEARLAARERMRPLHLALAAAALVLLGLALRGDRKLWRELWVALALGACLIPFAVEMTCYYYAFLIVPALLATLRRAVAPILLGLSAVGQFLSLAPIDGLPTWRDELYTALSLATVVALAAILLLFARPRAAVPEA